MKAQPEIFPHYSQQMFKKRFRFDVRCFGLASSPSHGRLKINSTWVEKHTVFSHLSVSTDSAIIKACRMRTWKWIEHLSKYSRCFDVVTAHYFILLQALCIRNRKQIEQHIVFLVGFWKLHCFGLDSSTLHGESKNTKSALLRFGFLPKILASEH